MARLLAGVSLSFLCALGCTPVQQASEPEAEAPARPEAPGGMPAVAPLPRLRPLPDAPEVLFKNVAVFNGLEDGLQKDLNVLVKGNVIAEISADDIPTSKEARIIDGGGRTLMPGLIDAHTHIQLTDNFDVVQKARDQQDLAISGVLRVEQMLEDGFTTARDLGGDIFALKRAIDAGRIAGPRLYPSGAVVSQTSGHGDFGDYLHSNHMFDPGKPLQPFERIGFARIADGVPEVLSAVRQNLRDGATQIKIMGGGGGSSPFDPIDTTQYSVEEWTAAVEAAADWGTYVTAHIFTDRAMQRAMDAGVKCFDHGFFMSDEMMAKIAGKGIFVGPQMWGLSPQLLVNPNMPKSKLPLVKQLLEKYKDYGQRLMDAQVKVVFATDLLGPLDVGRQSMRYELYWRTQAFGSNFEVLKQATSNAAELVALSGARNPYKGKLGVVEEGALADLLLVEGNPLEDITVLGASDQWFDYDYSQGMKPTKTLVIVMKDGRIFRDVLEKN